MSVRFGFGFGVQDLLDTPETFGTVVDLLEELRFDSLWMSERVAGPVLDPLAALAFAAGRTSRLKLGTSVLVVPGRNPVLLAKQLATIDAISGGRLLPAFGLGTPRPAEQAAFGVRREDRAGWFDEAVPLMVRLWREDEVTHAGVRFATSALSLRPRPVGRMEIWTGGRTGTEYDRTGRLAQGWLGAAQTPVESRHAREQIERAAARHGRAIDDDHFGMIISYAREPLPPEALAAAARLRPDVDIAALTPVGAQPLVDLVGAYVAAGMSKFVLIPAGPPKDWAEELHWLAPIVRGLEG